MIPKTLYYVWVGGAKKPEIFYKCLHSWKKNLPNYDIIEINESNFDLDYHLNHNKFFKVCYDRKMWAFVSDYMRVIHLYEHGGIYLDTDMEILQDFSHLITDKTEFFAGFEDEDNVNVAILGSAKGSQILKSTLEFYDNEIWHSPLFTIPSIVTHILNNHLPINDKLKYFYFDEKISIYPSRYFYPYHYSQKFTNDCVTTDTYGIHWWGHSWNKDDDYLFLRTKHLSGISKLNLSFLVRLKRQINKVKSVIIRKQ